MRTLLRLLLLCSAAAVAVAMAAAAAAESATSTRLKSPRLAAIVRASTITDSTLRPSEFRHLLEPRTYWGSQYTTTTGESVTVYASVAYPQDPAIGQRWANFLASLVHGSELSLLTAYLAPLSEVQSICGEDSLACYSPNENLLVAPGDDPSVDTSAEAVVTHEYGHHVAAHRSNAPWEAIDYGTKRWASYEQVCTKTRLGMLFPGAEMLPRYTLNPGEAFAETYRVLNERLAGLPEAPWDVVSDSLYPDDTALSLVQQDVTTPWRADTTTTLAGSLKSVRVRTYTVAVPLDGTLRVRTIASRGERVSVDVLSSSTRVAHVAGSGTVSTGTTICGQRTVRVRVTRLAGTGTFRLAIAKP